jgi:hypothetical protein
LLVLPVPVLVAKLSRRISGKPSGAFSLAIDETRLWKSDLDEHPDLNRPVFATGSIAEESTRPSAVLL